MDITATMTIAEKAKVQSQVDAFNAVLNGDKLSSNTLDKNDFLEILMTQLTHQDPTEPMDDKEFIAQMAQFSTLEQMTNMNTEFSKLTSALSSNQALNLLGRTVDIIDGETLVSGKVEEVTGQDVPMVFVNGSYYDYDSVQKVRE